MKFYLWSDVHNEFGELPFNKDDYNSECPLIIAGDWGTATEPHFDLLHELCEHFDDVVFVTGNHDYYHGDIQTVHDDFEDFAWTHKNFHFLENSSVMIKGVNIVGACLWTDIDGANPLKVLEAKNIMNDFHYIKNFSTDGWLHQNEFSSYFLFNALDMNSKNLIVTHHAPHEACIEERFYNSPYNHLYANSEKSGLYQLFDDTKFNSVIVGWCHGHMHTQSVIDINGIPVFRNARGYHKYEETARVFQANTVFETK